MLVTGCEATCDECFVALEIDQTDVLAITNQDAAIAPLQRRARNDAMTAGRPRLVYPFGDRREPRPPVFVSQRNAAMHLVDISWGMKPIAVLELPLQTHGQQRSDGGLSRSGYAHDDQHRGIAARRPIDRFGLRRHYVAPVGNASRSVNQWRRPIGRTSAAGIAGSPARTRATICRLDFPATKKATSRLLSSAG